MEILAELLEQIIIHLIQLIGGAEVAEVVMEVVEMQETKRIRHQHKILDHLRIQERVDLEDQEHTLRLTETHMEVVEVVVHLIVFGHLVP
jgi:hypothetical protein